MFSIIRNTLENRRAALKRKAASEINPDLYIQRHNSIIKERIKEAFGMVGFIALSLLLLGTWLAYEGWITPATFKGIL